MIDNLTGTGFTLASGTAPISAETDSINDTASARTKPPLPGPQGETELVDGTVRIQRKRVVACREGQEER